MALESTLEHLLSENNPLPSDVELGDINPLIRNAQQELTSLPDYPQQLESLTQSSRSVTPSLRRMPPELISEIFIWCVLETFNSRSESWNPLHTMHHAPWNLTHVSKLWGALALSQTKLWSYIGIDLQELAEDSSPEPHSATLELFLKRSKNHPLNIYFRDSYKPTPRTQELLNSLILQSHRWERVALFVSFQHLELTTQVRDRIPILRSLDIIAYGANTFGSLDAFQVAPELQDVSIVIGDPYTLKLPWAQITSFAGDLSQCPNFLRDTPHLTNCDIKLFSGPLAFPPICLQHLISLRSGNIRPLIFLQTPALETLDIRDLPLSTDLIVDTVYLFLRESSCTGLKVLRLGDLNIEHPSVFLSLLQAAPKLVRLEVSLGLLHSWNIDEHLLEPLTVSDGSCLLANLRSLRIHSSSYHSPASIIEPLVKMIESRWNFPGEGTARINDVEFSGLSQMQETDPLCDRMKLMVEQGLRVVSFAGWHSDGRFFRILNG